MKHRIVGLMVTALAGCGLPDGVTTHISTGALMQETFSPNPGSLSLYVYTPSSVASKPALVVAMHGCTQSAADYEKAGWNSIADREGFIVAYPQTTGSGSCFEWFNAGQQSASGPQVSSIVAMVNHLKQTKNVDSARVFVTGLSAGGAMTHVLLATAPDVFAAGAVFAGIPFGCASSQSSGVTCAFAPPSKTAAQWGDLVRAASGANARKPRVSLWTGTADSVVAPANMTEGVKQWTNVHGIDSTIDVTATVSGATHNSYTDSSGTVLVESWSIPSMNHGVAVDPAHGCGTAGAFILDVGLCSSAQIAAFFGLTTGAASLDGGAPSTIDAGTPGTPVDAGQPSHGDSCTDFYATNVNHFVAHRAQLCNARYCAVGSGDLLGDSLDMTWVRQTRAGYFEAGQCGVVSSIDAGATPIEHDAGSSLVSSGSDAGSTNPMATDGGASSDGELNPVPSTCGCAISNHAGVLVTIALVVFARRQQRAYR